MRWRPSYLGGESTEAQERGSVRSWDLLRVRGIGEAQLHGIARAQYRVCLCSRVRMSSIARGRWSVVARKRSIAGCARVSEQKSSSLREKGSFAVPLEMIEGPCKVRSLVRKRPGAKTRSESGGEVLIKRMVERMRDFLYVRVHELGN